MDLPANATETELTPHQKLSLFEFRSKLEDAIITNRLLHPPCHRYTHSDRCLVDVHPNNNVSLWGIPLLPSRNHEGTNIILLKFLRARDFHVLDAFSMLQKTLRWRKDYAIDGILDEQLEGLEIDSDARDKEGHPVCFNKYGVLMRDKEVYRKMLGDDEKRERFLRWRVQVMERDIKKQLIFKPGGVGSMVQITDLKNSLSPNMKELRSTTNKIISLFQDNYPEFMAKNIIINVSFRYYAHHALFSSLFSQRSKSKFIFVRPNKVLETLLKYIPAENIPVEYGGFKRLGDDEFSATDGGVSEVVLRGGYAKTIAIPTSEGGLTAVWDVTVVGWEVHYKEEFIPDDEGSYRVLITKDRKLEESVRNSFYISEPGKVVVTLDNRTLKKKKIFYRTKIKPTVPLYNLITSSP